MANVKEITERLVQKEEEIMNGFIGMMSFKAISNMTAGEFEQLKAMYELITTANELMFEYAKVIDDMNAKLDRIENGIKKEEQA